MQLHGVRSPRVESCAVLSRSHHQLDRSYVVSCLHEPRLQCKRGEGMKLSPTASHCHVLFAWLFLPKAAPPLFILHCVIERECVFLSSGYYKLCICKLRDNYFFFLFSVENGLFSLKMLFV